MFYNCLHLYIYYAYFETFYFFLSVLILISSFLNHKILSHRSESSFSNLNIIKTVLIFYKIVYININK